MVSSIEPREQVKPAVETSTTPRARVTPARPGLADQLISVKDELVTLYQQELALAKTEISEGLDKTKASAGALGTGTVMLIGGFMLLLTTLSMLIGWGCNVAGMAIVPALLTGFASMTVISLIVGAVMLKAGKKKLVNKDLTAPKTMDTLRSSKEIVKDKAS